MTDKQLQAYKKMRDKQRKESSLRAKKSDAELLAVDPKDLLRAIPKSKKSV